MFSEALAAWLTFLASMGMDVPLNPPATEQKIAAAEAEIGFTFPDDLRQLYRAADGQRDSLEVVPRAPKTAAGPMFGAYEFVPLESALREYRSWKSIRDEAGAEFASTYDWTTARAGDPVHPDYWRPGWFPFALDGGGNAYAVDLSPAPGGTYGQIILIGRDEDERRVLAPSLGEFLREAARRRPAVVERQGHWLVLDIEGMG